MSEAQLLRVSGVLRLTNPLIRAGEAGRSVLRSCTRFEFLILAALLITAQFVYFKDDLLSREITISPATPAETLGQYQFDDSAEGGKSTVAADSTRPLSWTCRIANAVDEPFCGVGFILGDGASKGIDLSVFKSFRIQMKVSGP